MKYIIFLAGVAAVFLLAYLVSNDRKKIKYRPILTMLGLQLILTYFLLNTGVGLVIIKGISKLFEKLLGYAGAGIDFVFGGLANEAAMPFFLNVLLPIVFISVLIGIAQHFRILPFIIKWVGFALSKVNGLGRLESYNAVASAVFGQSEVFISVKNC